MKEIDDLVKLVSAENQEKATALLATINSNIEGADSDLNLHESKKLEAIKSRDAAKMKYKQLLTTIGVPLEGVDDGKIATALAALKGTGKDNDKALAIKEKEIESLKAEVQTAGISLENERTASSQILLNTVLERDIATVLPKYGAKANATSFVTDAIKRLAEMQDGMMIFKNADGTTLRIGGKDAKLDDVVRDMRDKEKESKESMFFNIDAQRSGAGAVSGGSDGDFVL